MSGRATPAPNVTPMDVGSTTYRHDGRQRWPGIPDAADSPACPTPLDTLGTSRVHLEETARKELLVREQLRDLQERQTKAVGALDTLDRCPSMRVPGNTSVFVVS